MSSAPAPVASRAAPDRFDGRRDGVKTALLSALLEQCEGSSEALK